MSLRAIGGKLFKHGTSLIRHLNKGKPPGRPPTRAISLSVGSAQQPGPQIQKTNIVNRSRYVFRNIGVQISQRARRVLFDDVVNRVSNKVGTEVFQKASQRGLYGNTAPLLTLVGVAVVSGQGFLTKDDELEGICWEIRECMSKIQWNRDAMAQEETLPENTPVNLQAFTFGKPIAKGANAVVYSAKVASEEHIQSAEKIRSKDNISGFPLALKMMFNYDIQSNSLAILRAMYRETVPASIYVNRHGITDYEYDFLNRTRHLPPHPNIVKIMSVFTDYVPELERCREMYPAALPKRIDPEGEGRNMSLFILMKRYHQNLQDYLNSPNKPTLRTSILLLTQLLEGVVHMVTHNVAHRDLKSDNVLLDLSDARSPLAVISDFGCCLAEKNADLSVAYTSYDIEKGGNTALMAPEIIGKKPGSFSKLHYGKSDLWAVGAMGYEIFGAPNPFYGNKSSRLSSVSYNDKALPNLPETVPSIFNRLIKNLLRRYPEDRLDPDIAATIGQIFLWAPRPWLDKAEKFPTYEEILEWLLNLAAKILCEGGNFYNPAESENKLSYHDYLLISTFLCRVKLSNIKSALSWMRSDSL